MENPNGRSRPFGLIGSLLAFALSAVLGIAFVLLVNKTHDLFSSSVFERGIPQLVASLGWEDQNLVGTWEGRWHDEPVLKVMVDRSGDQLSGKVIFQPIGITQAGARINGAPVSVPFKDARFDGKTLRFRLDDERAAQAWRAAGVEMTLTSANQAALKLAGCFNAEDTREGFGEVVLIKTA
jgi:hypothetical protein